MKVIVTHKFKDRHTGKTHYKGEVLEITDERYQEITGAGKFVMQIFDNEQNEHGDSDNDVPMFKVCKTSIVMGKCTPKARDAATYITGLIEEGGLADAVRKYVLNEKKA